LIASIALGTTGKTSAIERRCDVTAAWKSRHPEHMRRCLRNGPLRSSPPCATDRRSLMSWHDALRASRSAIKVDLA
jgi:hypothetical protein